MSSLRADAAATHQDNVRQLRVGSHDVIEDQWRGESDAVNQVLLNNTNALALLNTGLIKMEAVTLAGSDTDITVGAAVGTLLGVLEFAADAVSLAGAATAWTPDADQVANPGLIAVAGTVAAGTAVVFYTAA